MAIHHKIEAHECYCCEKIFGLKRYLVNHVKRVHENKKPSNFYECNSCEKIFNRKSNIEKHVKTAHES